MLGVALRTTLLMLVAIALVACGEAVKPQDGLRGRWVLKSRTLPGGQKVSPPEVCGIREWYPLDEQRAYITLAFSKGREDLKLSGSIITLDGVGLDAKSFTEEHYLRMADRPGIETTRTTSEGQISVVDSTKTFSFSDGSIQIYGTDKEGEDPLMTVTYNDGTVDLWKRSEDLPGLLPE